MEKRICRMILALVSIGIVAAAGFTGCGTVSKIDEENTALSEEFENAPEWVMGDAKVEGGLSAVGSAKIGKAGIQFARTEAMAHGRSELAQQLSVKVKTLVNNFAQQVGIGDGQTLDLFSEQVSKQVTQETISGSKRKDIWISPSSDLYVLIVVDPEMVKASVKNRIVTSYKDDEAAWQKFQAANGSKKLDAEIEETFGQ